MPEDQWVTVGLYALEFGAFTGLCGVFAARLGELVPSRHPWPRRSAFGLWGVLLAACAAELLVPSGQTSQAWCLGRFFVLLLAGVLLPYAVNEAGDPVSPPGRRTAPVVAAVLLAVWGCAWTLQIDGHGGTPRPALLIATVLQVLTTATGLGMSAVCCLSRRWPRSAVRLIVGTTVLSVASGAYLAVVESSSLWGLLHTDFGTATLVQLGALLMGGVLVGVTHDKAVTRGRGLGKTAVVGLLLALTVFGATGYRAAVPATPQEISAAPAARTLTYDPRKGNLCGLHGKGQLALVVERARAAGTAVTVSATDHNGPVSDLQGVSLTFTHLESGRTVRADLTRRDGGTWTHDRVALGLPGAWQVTAGVGMSAVTVPADSAVVNVL
ncbi:hypothetical protein ABT071_36655 [Streptomyces sp. NPDC002506]|uniref:hypothetical protein n=1 Tax=Streptomyces sp. NPDC002506 TaxID=3154536 RepID=UPI0033296218